MEQASIKSRLERIRGRIEKSATSCGRDPEDVKLVAVSKTIPAESIQEAIEAGADIFGENYIQEAREKIAVFPSHDVSWHFIGHLQSNKAKYAVKLFDLIHSVDSLKLARELNKQAEKIGKIQQVLIQVNISMETTKSGVAGKDAISLVRDISQLEYLSVQGLMTMPPYYNEPEKTRPYFSELKDLSVSIANMKISNIFMNELSMGMTGDFEAAIEEGATLVRVGTAIFGERY